MSEQRKKFTVERSKWIRGRREVCVRLLRPIDGYMCCLGFVCVQLGVPRASILDKYEPGSLSHGSAGYALIKNILVDDDRGFVGNSPLATAAIDINDSQNMEDAEREHLLSALFAEYGYEMEFVP
jgi:hypothetical protein